MNSTTMSDMSVNSFAASAAGLPSAAYNTSAYSSSSTIERRSNPFASGFAVMMNVAELMQEVLNEQYYVMQQRSERANQTKDIANRMDEVISNISKEDEKATKPIPEEIVNYMKANGILVDGKPIDKYIDPPNGNNVAKSLNKGQLQAIKAALDNSFNADTDMLKQQQLVFDRNTNTYTAMFNGVKSLIDKWGRVMNAIFQG